jgi:hypothetical protein
VIKKFLCVSLVTVSVLHSNISAFGFSLPVSNITTPTVIDSSVLNDSTNFSFKTLESSVALLGLSQSLLANSSTANTEYVEAMLQLSTDIGAMANRIGEMADRILVMSDSIGVMADRILETQRIQSKNVELTQINLLKAQENFNKILNAR